MLRKLNKQTPTPEPEQVDRQKPDEGSTTQHEGITSPIMSMGESASSSIPKVSDSGMSKYDTAQFEVDWPPKNTANRVLIENTINAHLTVHRVIKDPVALALMKGLIEQGAV